MDQVAQRNCGSLEVFKVRSDTDGPGQPGLVPGIPTQGRGAGTT